MSLRLETKEALFGPKRTRNTERTLTRPLLPLLPSTTSIEKTRSSSLRSPSFFLLPSPLLHSPLLARPTMFDDSDDFIESWCTVCDKQILQPRSSLATLPSSSSVSTLKTSTNEGTAVYKKPPGKYIAPKAPTFKRSKTGTIRVSLALSAFSLSMTEGGKQGTFSTESFPQLPRVYRDASSRPLWVDPERVRSLHRVGRRKREKGGKGRVQLTPFHPPSLGGTIGET